MMSEYEKLRHKNRADNKKILEELGILKPNYKVNLLPLPFKKSLPLKKKKSFVSAPIVDEVEETTALRRSKRKRNQVVKLVENDKENDKFELSGTVIENSASNIKVPANRPNFYGSVIDVPVGTTWLTRHECCLAGVHRPTVAGIHGGPDGAYSIALSGGYEDDIDHGDMFTYTGEGGRDLRGTKTNPKNLRTAPQSCDQTLTRGNLALSISNEKGNPIRVIRGYKLKSCFAPEEGYRYDGLYKVEKYWLCKGLSGFRVYKFAVVRCDSEKPPWKLIEPSQRSCESAQDEHHNATDTDTG